ncbi:MAG: myo-inosose-2 dehydratase [Lachnospiraceae bacterium]|jgi:inosose dehydratase|nr:myo-inosose-2 dehydratase [Lachnospiraceae bacterium]
MSIGFSGVRIGVHPINWCNDDMHDLGDEYSFEDIIDQAAEAGYAGIELGRKFPRDADLLRRELEKRGLELTSGWCDTMFGCPQLRGTYMEAFREKAAFLKAAGAKLVVAAEVTGSSCWDPREYRGTKGVEKLDDEGWGLFLSGLDEAGEYCNGLGMRLVYHVHSGTAVETTEETRRLVAGTDAGKVSILADTGHLTYCGNDLAGFFREFAPRIKYVHLKNLRPLVMDEVKRYGIDFNHAVRCGVFTVPGDGGIDFMPVFEALAQGGYTGWMVVEAEQYLPSPPPLWYAKLARGYIKETTGL